MLGDLARSPRMLNHVRALVAHGHPVSLIGYRERPVDAPDGVRICRLHPLRPAGARSSTLKFLVWSAIRMSLVCVESVVRLVRERPACILVQNPPSFPALLAAWCAARLRRARLVIDWHNYGYTVLALRLPPRHPMLRLARWYELAAGRLAGAHLCVSAAFREDLAHSGIAARVLYDRPVELAPCAPPAARDRGGRLVAVCPTGFAKDEDLGLLLAAVTGLVPAAANPRVILELHITGDGPGRADFEQRIAALALPAVVFHTGFHPWTVYRDLMRRADLGISLHRSSSGVDLPMKVVDMFAARVPVCALACGGSQSEQITDGVTGWLFSDAEQLAALLRSLIENPGLLDTARYNIARDWRETWAQAWEREAAPAFRPV